MLAAKGNIARKRVEPFFTNFALIGFHQQRGADFYDKSLGRL